jgi:hypothetical protein
MIEPYKACFGKTIQTTTLKAPINFANLAAFWGLTFLRSCSQSHRYCFETSRCLAHLTWEISSHNQIAEIAAPTLKRLSTTLSIAWVLEGNTSNGRAAFALP